MIRRSSLKLTILVSLLFQSYSTNQLSIAKEKVLNNIVLIPYFELVKRGIPLKNDYESTSEYRERINKSAYIEPANIGGKVIEYRPDWDKLPLRAIGLKYDADREVFHGSALYADNLQVYVARRKARLIAGRETKVHLEGDLRYYDETYAQMRYTVLVDEVTGERFPIASLEHKYSSTSAPAPAETERFSQNIHDIPNFKSVPKKDDFAVVIGVENYQSLPSAVYAKSDAGIVKDYLKALGFQSRNVEFLLDERATKSSIEKSIEAWLPNRVKKDSSVFVFYSGHGAPDPANGDAYLVPYDGDPNYISVTGYPVNRLYDRLGKLQAKEIVVVLDACFSGAGGRSVLAKGTRPLVIVAEGAFLNKNMVSLTATHGSQISTSSPEKGHGLLTYYFLKAIKDGKSDIAEIYDQIKPQIEDEAKILNVQQSPRLTPEADAIKGKFNLRAQ